MVKFSKLPRKRNSPISRAIQAALHEQKRLEKKRRLAELIENWKEQKENSENRAANDDDADTLQILVDPEDILIWFND